MARLEMARFVARVSARSAHRLAIPRPRQFQLRHHTFQNSSRGFEHQEKRIMALLTRISPAISLALLTACAPAEQPVPKEARYVETIVIEATEVSGTTSTSGKISARIQADLSFRVGGRIAERMVDVGDHVKAGQVLARIDDKEQKADLQVALANLRSAQAQRTQAQLSYTRQQSLIATSVTTQAAVDSAREALLTAQATVRSAEAQVDTAKDTLQQTVLKSEADGIITARNAEVGQVVQAAQAIVSLAYDGPRDAVINIDEAALLGRGVEDVAEVRLLSGGGTYKARVREVSPSLDTTTGTIRVKLGLEGGLDAPLGSSVVVTARYKPQTVIELPWSSMASSDGRPAVWLVDPNTRAVSLHPVGVTSYAVERFSVGSGLNANDVVVSNGTKFLSDGDVVTFEGATP